MMTAKTLDPDGEEFRAAGHAAIDWIADHFAKRDSIPVLASVKPGEIASSFAAAPSREGRAYDELMQEFREKVLPGITHWNHPAFFAYFSITGSAAGVLGELLSAALNVNGMLWRTSPAATELEVVALDWLRGALGLPEGLFGIINDTASINSFLGLAAAREAAGLDIRTEGMTGRALPQMRVYCSDQAHSSIEKGAIALGFGTKGVTKIPSDGEYRMNVEALRQAIAADRAAGVVPCAVAATIGTTSTTSVDPIPEIASITSGEGIWLHVDAAYSGSAAIAPEYRWIWNGIEQADSIVVNPHKWLFTPVDCSVLFTRRPEMLKQTFSLIPEYLKTTEGSEVINYMDYGLQLGRRFRALKLWMVLEHYGTAKLAEVIREQIGYAARLEAELRSRNGYEILAPRPFSVVAFRKVVRGSGGKVDEQESESATQSLIDRMNASGEVFVSHTRLQGKLAIRVAIGNGQTEWRHVERILNLLD